MKITVNRKFTAPVACILDEFKSIGIGKRLSREENPFGMEP
jgi:hypothetical protein